MAASSCIPPTLPESDGRDGAPGSVLLGMCCYIADRPNATTATGVTSRGLRIQVTFHAARPPTLSHFCVHCLGTAFSRAAPTVVATHADLVLLRVPNDPDGAVGCCSDRCWDFFVYRAHPPLLDLLPNPYPKRFNDSEAALLSHGGGYIVAALRNRIPWRDPISGALIRNQFDLHLYRSAGADEGWVTKPLSVQEPVRDTLVPLPAALADEVIMFMYHETGKTITIGGERGTVAWVDLWRGIILCHLLDECPVLSDVPLPLPARGNWGRLLQECEPNLVRDVTVSRSKDSIKYIEMEIRPPIEQNTSTESYLEWVRRNPHKFSVARRDGWKATAWSMPIPVGSWEDWRRECEFDVNEVDVTEPQLAKPLSKLCNGDTKAALQRLSMAYPTISMDGDVVYLLSKVDKLEVVVAIDVTKKKLRGVAELDIQKEFIFMPSYCSSEISSHLKRTTGTLEALKPTEKEKLRPAEVRAKEQTGRMRRRKKHVWRRVPLSDAVQFQIV